MTIATPTRSIRVKTALRAGDSATDAPAPAPAVSNIMKTKNDTVKNTISNIH